MSKQANPKLIGGFVLGAVVLMVAGVLVFGSGRFLKERREYVLFFDSSLQGLNVGALVQLKGVTIGAVRDIKLLFNPDNVSFRTPVYIEVEPDRVSAVAGDSLMKEVMEDIDIEVTHDRADITGNNNDSVFQERVYKEGNPDQEGDLHHSKMWNARTADASKLAWYLEKIGQPSVHWKKIVRKEIEPLHLVANKFDEYRKKGAIGAGKQNARTDIKGTTKVSYSDISGNEGSSGS